MADPVKPLLDVQNLQVEFRTERGAVRAVDGVSFSIAPGEVFGLAGESGSGKSTIALSLMRVLPPAGRDHRRPGALRRSRCAGVERRTTPRVPLA
ncbi:MAG: ATP-binding cassette domain-containing protein [Thermomicrobiales bacterium]